MKESNLQAILAILVTIGFFGLVGVIAFHSVPVESKDVVNILCGTFATSWGGCMGYFFGSSSSSKNKDFLLFNSKPVEPNVNPIQHEEK